MTGRPTRVRIAAALVVLVLAGAAALAWYAATRIDARRALGELLADANRTVELRGPLEVVAALPPHLAASDVEIRETGGAALWRSARIGRVEAALDLRAMLRGEVELRGIELDSVVVELRAAGATGATPPSAAAAKPPGRVSVSEVEIRDLSLVADRGAGSEPVAQVDRLAFAVRGSGYEGELRGRVAATSFDVSGRYDPADPQPATAVGARGTIDGIPVSARGETLDWSGRALALRVEATAPGLDALSQRIGVALPALGPVRATGLVRYANGALGVSELDVRAGDRATAWLELTGSVGDLRARRDLSLAARFGTDALRRLEPLLVDPPDVGKLEGELRLSDPRGRLRIDHFALRGGTPGVFEIDAEGHLDDLAALTGVDAHVDLSARDLSLIGKLVGRELPSVSPVAFTGRVRERDGELSASDARATLDRTEIRGSLALKPGGARPRIRADLTIPVLYLDDVGIVPTAPGADDGGATGRVFGDERFDLSWLGAADAQLALRVPRMHARDELLRDVRIDGSLQAGHLSLHHIAAHPAGGSLRGSLEIESNANPPALRLKTTVDGIDLAGLLDPYDDTQAWSGQLDARVELNARGTSPRALAAGLDGRVEVSSDGGTIATEYASRWTLDAIGALRRVTGLTSSSQRVRCLRVDFDFKSGVGTARTLVFDAEDLLVVGGGRVDLAREQLDLRLIPKPIHPNPATLTAAVVVSGPLSKPIARVDKLSVVTRSTRALLDTVTSIVPVPKLLRRLTGTRAEPDGSICRKIDAVR